MASPLTIQPDAKDCSFRSDQPNTNISSWDLYIGDIDWASIAARSLIAFDVSGVPAGNTVSAVELSLYWRLSEDSGGAPSSWSVEVHRMLRNWTEAQATWNIAATGTNWGTAGASNTSTDCSNTVSAALTLDGTYASSWSTWSGAGLVADVQAWVDGTASNYGWMLKAPAVELSAAVKDNLARNRTFATTSLRPKLVVTYTEAATGCPKMTDHYARLRRG